MKNLYNRLKPDVLASINKDQQRYPYTTRSLKIKLPYYCEFYRGSLPDEVGGSIPPQAATQTKYEQSKIIII